MRSAKTHGYCWLGSGVAAILYAAVPNSDRIFPGLFVAFLAHKLTSRLLRKYPCRIPRRIPRHILFRLPRRLRKMVGRDEEERADEEEEEEEEDGNKSESEKSQKNDKDPLFAKGPVCAYFKLRWGESKLFLFGLAMVSMGVLADLICRHGPQKEVDWRQLIVVHALIVFTVIGRVRDEARDLPFPRIPRSLHVLFVLRRFYADTVFWAIAAFEVLIFNGFLKFCGAPAGIRDVFFPLKDEVNMGFHLVNLALLTPLFDSAETLFFAMHEQLLPCFVPAPDARELEPGVWGEAWTKVDVLEITSVTTNALFWILVLCYYRSRDVIEATGVQAFAVGLLSSWTSWF